MQNIDFTTRDVREILWVYLFGNYLAISVISTRFFIYKKVFYKKVALDWPNP